MTIASVQGKFPELLIDNGTVKNPGAATGSSAAAFGSLLDRLNGTAASPTGAAADPQRAMMEVLRLEMLQSSLGLGSVDDGAPQQGSDSLPNLISGLLRGVTGTPGAPGAPGAAVSSAATAASSAGANASTATTLPQSAPPSGELDSIQQTAARFLGTTYRFGGEGPNGIDCSSFVQQVFQEHQVDLPRTAREQNQVGTEVPVSDLRKGDLVFFRTYASYPSHVGIYLGDGKMIHASSGKGEVTVSDMNSGYYRSRFLGAKRVV